MTALAIVSVVSLLGWLVLALSALKSHEVPKTKLLQMALLWVGLFALAAFAFGGMR
ncbi:hypothetical protein [uncultured Croceicoccus sp.]|uniref:hypothetical protein n=1 Tax=uncultured Croceicoccus sp. TaxID=1295329 RepID=UPI00261221A5|nr:hypothetical protein [uncultured Croceicoccus sp.]